MSAIISQMSLNLPNVNEVPDNFAIKLPQVSAIRLRGEEQKKYLQGQVTCDVNEHSAEKLMHGAHCDAKGKVLSVFRLIEHQGDLLLIQPANALASSLAELKKFGVFAKVDIELASELSFACAAGSEAEAKLKLSFDALPDELSPVIHKDSASLIYVAGESRRYLIVAPAETLDDILKQMSLPNVTNAVWDLYEIIEGFPILNSDTIGQYVPQMLNLDKINGISFTKGCYLGQETVARMQYLGKNKKMMGLISGTVAKPVEQIDGLEKQLGENWRGAGDILHYYQSGDGTLYIQAVIANDLTSEDKLRLKGDESSSLTLTKLAYLSA